MAWTSAHFAVGMACGGALAGGYCAWRGKGWWAIPAAMTLGGLWAVVPDLPRIFREDLPALGLGSTLGAKQLEQWLHSCGDVFFFHRMLDAQPREFALHGLAAILLMYNAALFAAWRNRRVRSGAAASRADRRAAA